MNRKILAFMLVILIIIAVVSVAIYQIPSENYPPIASATADSTCGKAPFVVFFDGSALDPDKGEVTYHWDFGDGSYSDLQNSNHTYHWSGKFIVHFTVKDEFGKIGTDTIEINVIDYYPPIASATADSTCGKAPLIILFDGSGYDHDGYVASYHWDFGDGSKSDKKNPEHSYEEIGKFIVHLTVTDDDGQIGIDTLEINVIKNCPPNAYASASKIEGQLPLKVEFNGQGYDCDGQKLSYHWDFGAKPIVRSAESKDQNATFTYWKEGVYTATLTVTDEDGAKDIDTVQVTVKRKSKSASSDSLSDFIIPLLTAYLQSRDPTNWRAVLVSFFNLLSIIFNQTQWVLNFIMWFIDQFYPDQNQITIQTANFATNSKINAETFFEVLCRIKTTQ